MRPLQFGLGERRPLFVFGESEVSLVWANVIGLCEPCGANWPPSEDRSGEVWALRDIQMADFPEGPDPTAARQDRADAKAQAAIDDLYGRLGPTTNEEIRRIAAEEIREVLPPEDAELVLNAWVDEAVSMLVWNQREVLADLVEGAVSAKYGRLPTAPDMITAIFEGRADELRRHRKAFWSNPLPLLEAKNVPTKSGLLALRNRDLELMHFEVCEDIRRSAKRLASTDVRKNPIAWDIIVGTPLASASAMRARVRSRFVEEGLTLEWIEAASLDGLADAVEAELVEWGYRNVVVHE